ncbi:hypothetical protein B9Z55_026396 [Caenorhabditis nigoni]|uniref:Uncharacterized protein n=1 Tax=Caenorhabditis nigoni TaxID=1611254 RepID=A0A2G5T350_9PELO|nr:hypothetical protein B9Z55_026396 [Caenorhabditis nigoni]
MQHHFSIYDHIDYWKLAKFKIHYERRHIACSRRDHTLNRIEDYRFSVSSCGGCLFYLYSTSAQQGLNYSTIDKMRFWIRTNSDNAFLHYRIGINICQKYVRLFCCGQHLKIILKLYLHLKRRQLPISWWHYKLSCHPTFVVDGTCVRTHVATKNVMALQSDGVLFEAKQWLQFSVSTPEKKFKVIFRCLSPTVKQLDSIKLNRTESDNHLRADHLLIFCRAA